MALRMPNLDHRTYYDELSPDVAQRLLMEMSHRGEHKKIQLDKVIPKYGVATPLKHN